MVQREVTEPAALRASFVERIERLLADVRGWLAHDSELSLNARYYDVEDELGRYDAPGLEIVHEGSTIAMIQPIAAAVIGAEGRIDVKGPLDEVPVVYLTTAGRMETRRGPGGDVIHVRPLFRGVQGPDWYWITGSRTREVRRIDEASFRAILVAVSDYEIADDEV